ncbi:MAG: hypothetical protein ACRD0P_24475 [Stackebrandtia sp.]
MTTAPLDHIATAYAALSATRHRLAVSTDVADTSGLANLADIAAILHEPASSPRRRDRIWVYIVNQTRHDSRGDWTIAAAGFALPGLRRAAARVARVWPHDDPAATDAEIVAAFIAALADIDLSRPRVCSRLIHTAFSAGRSLARRHIHNAHLEQKMRTSRVPPPPSGHIDFVLARAVHDDVIDADAAELIAATRIEHTPLTTLAATRHIDVEELSEQRATAEAALAGWLTTVDA